MDKKQYLQKILVQLEPIRDLAKWLEILVEEWNLWDDALDILIDTVQWAVNTAKSDIDKEKLQKWLNVLQKMKQIEEESKLQDEKELKELDDLIDSF
jgi:predicted  nucleic acid-binding Zn-ribbon protein